MDMITIKNWTLRFREFLSPQDASILKIPVPIIKRRPWGFQNTPSLHDLKPSYRTFKKQCFDFPSPNLQSKLFVKTFFLWIAITWPKIIQTSLFWNPQDFRTSWFLILMHDASLAENLTKTRVHFLSALTKGGRKDSWETIQFLKK